MSSSTAALPHELAASREDFELFRRLMRVARLMELQDNNSILENPERALAASTQLVHPGGELLSSDTDTLLRYTNVLTSSAQDDYNYDDDDDEDDADDETARQDSLLDPQLFRPVVGQNPPATPQSIHSTPRSQRRSIKTPIQNQAQEEGNEQPKRQKLTQQDPPEQRRHAAVEKRYRSVINSKIKQLNDSIPPFNTYSTSGDGKQLAQQEPGEAEKVSTKAVVLDRALQYINNLVSTYERYEKERNDIHGRLKIWLDEFDTVSVSDTVHA